MKETDKEEQVPMAFRGHKIKYRDLPKEEKITKVTDGIGAILGFIGLVGFFNGITLIINIIGMVTLVSGAIYTFLGWKKIDKTELAVITISIIAITAIVCYFYTSPFNSVLTLDKVWHGLMFSIVFVSVVIVCIESAY